MLETGKLRDSIKWNADETKGCVGGNDTSLEQRKIPARPFLGPALYRNEAMIVNLFEKAVAAAALRAERVASREFRELVHGLKELAHAAKEFGEELMKDDDSEERR